MAVAAGATSITNAVITDLRGRAYTNGHWNTAWGEIAVAKATTSQTGISNTEVDITNCSVTWDAIAGRKYETTLRINVFDTLVAGTGAVFINNGSGTRVGQGNQTLAAGASTNFTVIAQYTASSSGSMTHKGRVINTGGASATITSTSDVPTYISVKDIGPA